MDQTSAATSTALQYGVLGIVALVFAYAIVHLFKTMRSDQLAAKEEAKAMEAERGKWAVEREQMRNEFERKHRELVDNFAETIREERDANRAHEDLVRKEFAEIMEQVASESSQASQALVELMQKLYDRLISPRR